MSRTLRREFLQALRSRRFLAGLALVLLVALVVVNLVEINIANLVGDSWSSETMKKREAALAAAAASLRADMSEVARQMPNAPVEFMASVGRTNYLGRKVKVRQQMSQGSFVFYPFSAELRQVPRLLRAQVRRAQLATVPHGQRHHLPLQGLRRHQGGRH